MSGWIGPSWWEEEPPGMPVIRKPRTTLSARGVIQNALYEEAKMQPDEVNHFIDALLDEHAHELAEKIRKHSDGMERRDYTTGALIAADLIDPEVNDA